MNDFIIRINGNTKKIKILDSNTAEIDNIKVNYSFISLDNSKIILKIDNKFYDAVYESESDDNIKLLINNQAVNVTIRSLLQEKAYQLLSSSFEKSESSKVIKSPMPGLVVKIVKNPGDSVSRGDTVIILEAMKMENEIKSIAAGKISEIYVEQGKAIEKNVPLFSIQ